LTAEAAEFDLRAEPFRGELIAYCYRMVGSAHDAEDLVQDTYLRAWRARERYDETLASYRTWLYRIATNVCLTALDRAGRRSLPAGLVAEREPDAPFAPGVDVAWLQPLPDRMTEAGEGTANSRSGLRLAFVAALQNLSARQRGALILREVLGFSAAETAAILGITVAAVNSSLQRARARCKEIDLGQEQVGEPSIQEQRGWVDRYMEAFRLADVEGIKKLLADDVLMEMPPLLNWFTGPRNYGVFMEWVFEANGNDWRLVPIAANTQPGFAAYNRVGGDYRPHTLQVFTVTARGITRNTVFGGADVFASFGLADRLG
jgi:RNA polymerase sigma-70 factor (ECF subfamily)